MESTNFSCQILEDLEFSWQIFKEYWNIRFHENPSSGNQVVFVWMDRQTDIHDKANSHFSRFGELS